MHDPGTTPEPKKWVPQFSLLTVLLLMALLACGITIAQLWREVEPLRSEVRSLRAELGFLNIEDPTKPHAVALQSEKPGRWKWRIYLPPGVKYRYACYSGNLPSPQKFVGAAWFDRVKNGGTGSGVSGTMNSAEFTLEAWLEKDGDQWQMRTVGSGGNGGFASTIHPSEWLSSGNNTLSMSDLNMRGQTVYEPGQPIMLVKVLKPLVTKLPGGAVSTTSPEGEADGFVLWIEEEKPPAPAKGNSQ